MNDNMKLTLSGTPFGTLELFVKVDDIINIIEEVNKRKILREKEIPDIKNITSFEDLERYYQNAFFNPNSSEDMYRKKIYSNAIWISVRLDEENMWTGFRFEEWGEIVLEYRNFNNVYCEVVIGKDKFYLMRRPHLKGITNPAVFDYTEDCMEVLNEELDKCKKLC